MNEVQAIRNINDIKLLREALNKGNLAERNVFMLDFGISVPMRISDLLQLKVSDVRGVREITIKESKTNKTNRFPVSDKLASIIFNYTEHMKEDNYLFSSQKGDKPMSRVQAYRILNKAVDWCGLDIVIGCHSLRKTYGYHFHNLNPIKHLAYLQKILNHSSSSVTLRYIGIEQDDIETANNELDYWS